MKAKLFRLLFLVVVLGLLGYGIARERHAVHPLGEGEPRTITGAAFVQGVTTDDFMLKNGLLYDVYSLSKATANEKDCKT